MIKEPLSLKHRELVHAKVKEAKSTVAEYSFSNLYLFREKHQYQVIHDEPILISAVSNDGVKYVMPLCDLSEIKQDKLISLVREYEMIFPVHEKHLPLFDPAVFDISSNDGDSDYIYTTEKIATYAGKHLHNKRNLLHQFLDHYSHDKFCLTPDRVADAKQILADWQAATGTAADDTDYHSCVEALERFDEIYLSGAIFYADNQPAGFIIGEELTPDMFVIHFAKARKEFKGIYQFMYNSCAGVLTSDYTYFNFEQDLGKAELRASKASYIPDMMGKKYRIRMK